MEPITKIKVQAMHPADYSDAISISFRRENPLRMQGVALTESEAIDLLTQLQQALKEYSDMKGMLQAFREMNEVEFFEQLDFVANTILKNGLGQKSEVTEPQPPGPGGDE